MSRGKQVFFIVGNSRSGTTMLMRILNNHKSVHSINEPHFFEQYLSRSEKGKYMAEKESIELFSTLLYVQREGQHKTIDLKLYNLEAKTEIGKIYSAKLKKVDVYSHFLFYETGVKSKLIPCEKTPQNIFYIDEILEFFPNARIINLIRDPRSVMLSQKKKWMRRSLGAKSFSTKELIRLRINYHPFTMSKLWNSSVGTAKRYNSNSQFTSIKYEELLSNPKDTLQELCMFLGIPFQKEMMEIPQVGSSSEKDDKNSIGIRSNRIYAWKEGGLNNAELFICEWLTKELMNIHDYERSNSKPNFVQLFFYFVSFPFKILLALIWNRKRIKSFKESIQRRIFVNDN